MKFVLIILISIQLKESTSFEINLDTDDFQTLLLNNDLYVDKSLLINEFLETKPSLLLIVRPSGWGKSINMDMFRRFFQPEVDQKGNPLIKGKSTNGKLFLGGLIDLDSNRTKYLKPLKIAHVSTATQYMGKHPVILLKMKPTTGNSYEEIINGIRTGIRRAFEDHRYLLNSSRVTLVQELQKHLGGVGELKETDLPQCLYFLSWKLFEHFGQKVIVLVDDYDTPLINAYLRFGTKSNEFHKVLGLLKNLYQTTLNFNPHLRKGLLSGTLKLSFTNETTGTGLNMLDISTLLNPKFSNFFGFTHPEVQHLLIQVPSVELINLIEMRKWYSGYHFDYNEGMYYYNSRSVMQCIRNNGTLAYYGLDTNKSTGLIDKLLSSDNMQPKIQQLISGQGLDFCMFSHTNPIRWDKISILETLLLNGYLRSVKIPFEAVTQRLTIPNKEMNFFYATKVLQWVVGKFAIDVAEFNSLAETLHAADIEGFEKRLQQYLNNTVSYIATLDDEAKVFYVGLMIALQRALASSHVTRIGETDGDIATKDEILLVPKVGRSDTAIVINYKRVMKTMELMASASIEEIRSGLYADKLKNEAHIKKIIKIGAAFCREKVLVRHEIQNL